MNNTTNTTEANTEAPEVITVNPDAWKNLTSTVKRFVTETDDPKSIKSHKRFLEVQEALGDVKILINDKVRKIKEARAEIAALTVTNQELQDIVDAEPVKYTIELRRAVSAFSGVKEQSESTPIDAYHVNSADVGAVLSRLKPIVQAEAGVVGIEVYGSDEQTNVFMFTSFIGMLELREGREFDIDADSADALMVYQEAMDAAFAMADFYTTRYGAYSAIPLASQKHKEASRIPGYVTVGGPLTVEGTAAAVETDEFDGADEDIAEEETDNESEDAEPSDEEIARRLEAEEEEDDVDSDEA